MEGLLGATVVELFLSMSRVRDPVWSLKALNRPPVFPIGASKIDTSAQLATNCVVPVHMHLPLTHAPFLLQWYGQVFFPKQ